LPLLLSCNEEPATLDCGFSCDDKTIKAWYKQKFGEPITEFELLTINVNFMHFINHGKACRADQACSRQRNSWSRYHFLATRTATNAYAEYYTYVEYYNSFEYLRAEFNMEEWLIFIRTLYKYGFDEWGEHHDLSVKKNEKKWLRVFSSDKEYRIDGNNAKQNWHKLRETTDELIETKEWKKKYDE